MRSFHPAVLAVALLAACADPPPAKLTIDSSGPIHFMKRGLTRQVTLAAFDAKGRPFHLTGKEQVTWSSSDPSVATVDAKGTITATGSGVTQVKAAMSDLEATVDATSSIPGSVEVKEPAGTTKDAPFKMRFKTKPVQAVVVVKDDKGTVIPKPKILYRAMDYCVDVSEDGLLTPLADGACAVQVSVGEQSAKIWLDVRE
jgi:hypothetical protein